MPIDSATVVRLLQGFASSNSEPGFSEERGGSVLRKFTADRDATMRLLEAGLLNIVSEKLHACWQGVGAAAVLQQQGVGSSRAWEPQCCSSSSSRTYWPFLQQQHRWLVHCTKHIQALCEAKHTERQHVFRQRIPICIYV
jgi:hypothetical protein